jgi:hypothetical protein
MSTVISPGAEAPPAHATVDAQNPWPGLEMFREGDEPFFRGRGTEAEELAHRVLTERLCILYGVSGLGKSSLLQAGLFPRVRDELFPVFIRLRHHEGAATPRQQVIKEVAEQAALRGVSVPEMDDSRTLWEIFHPTDHAFWTSDFRPVVPLLVFDQFEEVFTTGRDSRTRERITAAFLDELGDLIEARPSRELKARVDAGKVRVQDYAFTRHSYKVLLVLREDYLADLEALAGTAPSLMHNRMRLTPLSGEAALEVTRAGGPALVPPADAPGEPGVGELIVRLVASEDDDPSVELDRLVVDPALLSLFCRELNERRKVLGRDSITPDLVKGNRNEILAQYYVRTLEGMDPAVRVLVEERLVTVGGHRNSEAWDNAVKDVGEEALQALIRGRLIRRDRQRIELTHDVLTGVVTQSRDRRRAEEDASREAERLRVEAEARAQEERERAEELEREAVLRRREVLLARRTTLIAVIAALVCLALAGVAAASARSAQIARQAASKSAVGEQDAARRARASAASDSVSAEKALASEKVATLARDSARRAATLAEASAVKAELAEDAATAARDSARQANTQLQTTLTAMRAVQDSVLDDRLKATVEAEAADHYVQIAGALHSRQLTRNAAIDATFRLRLDSLQAQAQSARRDVARIREEANQRVEVFQNVLCANVARGQKGDTTEVTEAALNALRAQVQRELTARQQEDFSCPARRGGTRLRPASSTRTP